MKWFTHSDNHSDGHVGGEIALSVIMVTLVSTHPGEPSLKWATLSLTQQEQRLHRDMEA